MSIDIISTQVPGLRGPSGDVTADLTALAADVTTKAATAIAAAGSAENTLAQQIQQNVALTSLVSAYAARALAQAALVTALTAQVAILDGEKRSALDGFNDAYLNYWIDSVGGSDGNAGTSRAAPWKTVAPLLALGPMSGRKIGYKRNGAYTPWNLASITGNDNAVVPYGQFGNDPFFDCTEAIPASWTLYSTGVYTITLNRPAGSADAKLFANYFRNSVPMRKVDSIANLSGLGNYVVYASGENSATVTLYMNAPSDPGADGAAYRWSKYGVAVNLYGQRGTIRGLHTFGPGAQDGGFKIGGDGSTIGGNLISECTIDWGNRHSVYCGSGALASIVEYCTFNGGANEIETGALLNAAGTANAIVFNATDHTMATCISRYNTYNGMGRPNYVTGESSNFTGPYGHDASAGVVGASGANKPMVAFSSIGDSFTAMLQGPGACGAVNTFTGLSYKNCAAAFNLLAANATINFTNLVEGSQFNRLVYNPGIIVNVNYDSCGTVVVKDIGEGYAGWLRSGEGTTAVTNISFTNSKFWLQGIRTANANPYFIYQRAGTLKIQNCKFFPLAGPPVTAMLNLGSAVTIDANTGGNTWPLGSNFIKAGTTYRGIAAWQAAGGVETGSVYQALPTPDISDSFNGADANLSAVPGWTQLNGGATDLQRKSNTLYDAVTSSTASVYTRGDLSSTEQYVRGTIQGLSGGGGLALRVVDQNNALFIRGSSGGSVQIMKIVAGAISQVATSTGVTAVIGTSDVIGVVRLYTDPFTGTQSVRPWIIVDGGLGNAPFQAEVGVPALNTEMTVGAIGRIVAGNLFDDAKWGASSLTYDPAVAA